ncbi:ankyrin repeat-containing domain protein [Podospora didyma]|uniref:Ankyrin repeat-containing domain protein n=1 Tax=Podospora didyma TaxID=330526 RepID=A0AAE0U416_9PEZI|nr:ankyrin repeat-containing domain protein [Podospora didyma]
MVNPTSSSDGILNNPRIQDLVANLSADEKKLYEATTIAKTLLDEVTRADVNHLQNSTSRKIGTALLPFITGVEQYGRGLDVFANSSEVLCPIWGTVRIVFDLAREFGEYFDKLAAMLADIGTVLTRLPRYPHLYPGNDDLQKPMIDIFNAIFEFCAQARHIFRLGQEKSRGIKRFTNAVGFATALRVLWKPFNVDFGSIRERITKNVQAIEAEADIAEKEIANKERHRDDARWSKAEESQRLVAEFIDDQSIAKVNAWLAPANVAANHKAASSLRHGESGNWFLEGKAFQTWLDDDNSFLWLHAIPGAGKTVLASSIINYLRDNVQSTDTGLAYFYCDYKDAQKQDPSKLLGTILAMLAKQKRAIFENIQDFFLGQLKDSPAFTATFDELLSNFATFLGGHFRRVVLVVDALDEADPGSWECLTQALKKLHHQCNVKILVTSRNELLIARAFEDLSSTSIEQSDVAPDIRDFIAVEISSRIKQRKLKLRDPELEITIRNTLVGGSKGMFQWVKCQIDALCQLRNDKAIRAALSNLPRTLQDTYIRILQRVENEHPDDVEVLKKVLCWLVRGVRDLSLDELAEAIAIDPESGEGSMDFDAVDTDPEDILELLGGLVTVSPEKVVSLAHYSVKEFLVSEDIRKLKRAFWIGAHDVESQLALSCLTYLCYDDFRIPLLPDTEAFEARLHKFKFLQYAVQAGALHAQRSEKDGHQDERVVDMTMRLLQCWEGENRNFVSWEEIHHRRKFDRLSWHHRPRPLLCAAWFGLTEAVRQLLAEGGPACEDLTGAFMAAVSNGHAPTVKVFLQNNEQTKQRIVDNEENGIKEVEFGTLILDLGLALYEAAKNGHVGVLGELLQYEVDIGARQGKDRTAIQAAALEGRVEAVKLLLERGASHGIPCKRYGTPLAAAAEKGHQRTVAILLDAGADPNGRGGWYSSPLISAIVGRNTNIIQLLLDQGADIHRLGGRHMYPLTMAASQGMDPLIQQLVDRGAKIEGSDALYYAALAGNLSTVALLLELGEDVNTITTWGKYYTALGAAGREGHLPVIQHLISEGADVSISDADGCDALQLAAAQGHIACLRTLLEAGASPCSDDETCDTSALVRAAAAGKDNVIEALFELGVPSGPTQEVSHALVAAAWRNRESTVRLLFAKGADVNDTGQPLELRNWCTPLEMAATSGHLEMVNTLLELGADVQKSHDGLHGTALTAAVDSKCRSLEVIEALLNAGADPNQVTLEDSDSYGYPLLHAIQWSDANVTRLLLDKGADVNTQHETLYTPVHMAAVYEETTIIDLLLERGGDVNLVSTPKDLMSSINDVATIEECSITALQKAAWHGNDGVIHKLVDKGAALAIVGVDDAPFISALQVAAYMGHVSTVKTLLELGADVSDKGGYFGTALQAAVSQGHVEVSRALLEAGATANELGVGFYLSPLMAACQCPARDEATGAEILRLLVENGADVNANVGGELPYPLQAACYNLPTVNVELLLDIGADPNALGGRYGTSLQVASMEGDEDVVRLLIARGADPNIQGGQYNTALQAAFRRGYFIVIRYLLQNGAVHDLPGGQGGCVLGMGLGHDTKERSWGCCGTLIHQLTQTHKVDVNMQYGRYGYALQQCAARDRGDASFYYLLDAGAKVNTVGGYFGTALTAAAWLGNMEFVEKLLELGADLTLGNAAFPNPAFGAIKGDEKHVLERLIEAGVDVVENWALQFAAFMGHLEIIRMLVRAGAPINPPSKTGPFATPLQAAVVDGDKEVIHYLLNRGADIHATGGKYGGVLNAAVKHCDLSTVEMFLQKGVDPNQRDQTNQTALQAAAARGSLEMAFALVQHGADVNATGGKYHTALQAACTGIHRAHSLPVMKLLIERGADVNARGGFYHTPLQAAAVSLLEDSVRYLLENGAEWAPIDHTIARYPALLKQAAEVLEKARSPAEREELEEGGAEGEVDDNEDEGILPLNVDSVPGFEKAWKKRSRWDGVREMSLQSLRQLSLKADAAARVSSLRTGDKGSEVSIARKTVSRKSTAGLMASNASGEGAVKGNNEGVSWEELEWVDLEVGDIGPDE